MNEGLQTASTFNILDNLDEGVIVVKADGTIQYMNRAALDLLSLNGQPAKLYEAVTPYEAWQTLLEERSSSFLYTDAGRIEVRAKEVSWQDHAAIQLLLDLNETAAVETSAARPVSQQIQALTRISQQLSVTLRLQDILQAVMEESLGSTQADGGQISLYQKDEGIFELQYERGKVADPLLTAALEEQVLESHACAIDNDLKGAAGIQAVLITPIVHEGIVAGLIRLYSDQQGHFNEPAIVFMTALANHVAIAIGNAQRFDELNQRSSLLHQRAQQIERFVESSRVFHGERPLTEVYEDLVYAIQEGLGYQVVSLLLMDQGSVTQSLRVVSAAGLPIDRLEAFRHVRQSWTDVQEAMKPEFELGAAYFVPVEKSSDYQSLASYQVGDLYSAQPSEGELPTYQVALVQTGQSVPVLARPDDGEQVVTELPEGSNGIIIVGPGELVDNTLWVPIEYGDVQGWINKHYLQTEKEVDQSWHEEDLFIIPLRGSRAQPIGLINLDAPNNGRRPTLNTAKALEIFANQAATAIENVRLFHNTREYADQLQQLHDISQRVLRERDFETQTELIVEGLQMSGWQRVSLTLRDKALEPTMLVTAGYNEAEKEALSEQLLPAEAWRERLHNEALEQFRTGSVYFLPADDSQVQDQLGLEVEPTATLESGAWHPQDLLYLPLYDRERDPIAIVVMDEPVNGRRPTTDALQIIELYAQVATSIIENAQLYQETQRQLSDLQTVNEVGQAISTILGLEQLLPAVGNALSDAFDVDSYYISLYQPEDNMLHFPVMVDEKTPLMLDPVVADRGPTNYIFRSGEPLLIRERHEWAQLDYDVYGEMSESYLGVPLRTADRVIGVVAIQDYQDRNAFDDDDITTLSTIASQVAVAIENARLISETLARSQELRILFEASHAISSTLDQERVLTAMGQFMLQAVGATGYTVYEWSRERDQAIVVLDQSAEEEESSALVGQYFPLSDFHLMEKVTKEQNAVVAQVNNGQVGLPHQPGWLADDAGYTVAMLPITIREEVTSVVAITAPAERREFNESELQLLAAIINQAGIALENAQLFEDTYQRERFFAALGRVSLAINATFDLPTVLNLICQESLSLFNVDGAYIWRRQESDLVGIAAQGHAKEEFVDSVIPAADPDVFASAVVQRGEGTFINNFQIESGMSLRLPQQESLRAVLGIPLKQESEIIGVLILVDKNEPERFDRRDIEQATVFGVQAAIAIQNAQLVTELRELNEQLDERVVERTKALGQERDRVQYLLRITTELSASLDQDRVLNRALELVNEVVHATQGGILLVDPDTQNLVYRAAFGRPEPLPAEGMPIELKPTEGLAGWIIKKRSAAVIDDTLADERWLDRPDSLEHRSVLGVPLISSDEVIGVLLLFHKDPNAFTKEQLELVEAAAIQVANAINNAQLYLLIRDQAERLGTMLREEQIEAAKSQAILESIADGVIVAESTGQVILANRPASLILDIPRSQLIGKKVNELLGLYGSSGKSWVETIDKWSRSTEEAMNTGSFLADRLTIEDKVVSVHLSPVFANGQFFGTVSIFRDVTKEVEVDRVKSEFVSTVSHELRTPMTSIKGYADLMLMGAAGMMTDPQVRYLKVIKNNADRLSMLVNDLLDISKIETGKTELDLRPVDVPQIIERVVDEHLRGRIEHEGKPMEVATDMAPSLPLVNADHARVTQILTNLLDNAFHYTPPNGKITVSAVANSDYVYISVSDTGIGMDEDTKNKIFDRFYRSEDADVQKVSGTGLGLAIVNSLVEMHGGRIKVDSAPGEGSTFTFNLPLVVEESDVV